MNRLRMRKKKRRIRRMEKYESQRGKVGFRKGGEVVSGSIVARYSYSSPRRCLTVDSRNSPRGLVLPWPNAGVVVEKICGLVGKVTENETKRKVLERGCWKGLERRRWVLVVPSGYYVIRETPPHRHALLLIDQQRVLFHFDVFLKALLVSQQVAEGFVGLLQLVLQGLDGVGDLGDLLQQLVVGTVVARLHLWPPRPLLQPRLRHSERRVLRSDVGFQSLYVALLFVDFLEVV